ncbi:MAG: AEC family transporter [Magnetospirillum sp.]|nr:AEC family transporter [Magnetospirillum sp.]
MDLIASLASVIAPVVLISLFGYAWARRGYAFDHAFVTRLITVIGAPCLVFSTLTRMRFPAADLAAMGGATLASLILFAAVGIAALRLARLPIRVYLPSLMFPNNGNMGLPVCLFAFGEKGLGFAMIYFAIASVGQFTLGPAIAMGRFRPSLLLKVPFLYAVLLALAVRRSGWAVPAWADNTVTLLAGFTIPLMLLALGAALADMKVSGIRRALPLSAGRIVLGLAGGWAVAGLFGLTGAARGALVIQSGMPVAVFNYLFARLYGNQPEEVASTVLLSTLLSYLTLPVVVAALL